MTDNILKWVQNWYVSNCGDEWEELYGIQIYTLANPGWTVKIDLIGTIVENQKFETIKEDNGDDWISCRVENNVFIGNGDETKFIMILSIFKKWVEQYKV